MTGHGVEELVGGILGVAGHKTQQEIAVQAGQLVQKVGKAARLGQILSVGVHILSQQGDLFITLGNQTFYIGNNAGFVPAALPTPDIGDDAVGAEIVAPIHY